MSDGHAKWKSMGRGASRQGLYQRPSSSGPVIDGKKTQ